MSSSRPCKGEGICKYRSCSFPPACSSFRHCYSILPNTIPLKTYHRYHFTRTPLPLILHPHPELPFFFPFPTRPASTIRCQFRSDIRYYFSAASCIFHAKNFLLTTAPPAQLQGFFSPARSNQTVSWNWSVSDNPVLHLVQSIETERRKRKEKYSKNNSVQLTFFTLLFYDSKFTLALPAISIPIPLV